MFVIGIDSLLAAETFGGGATYFEDMDLLHYHLQQTLTNRITCLIKGSRFMRLDRLVDMLINVKKIDVYRNN